MTRPPTRNSHSQIACYALISLVAFFCSIAILGLLIVNAEKLAALRMTQHFYFLALVPMGLSAAVFVFGILRSSATYTGKLLGGTLRLGGTIVGAALVVAGGYLFIPNPATFPLTIYVHGEAGPQDLVLRNSGRVLIRLGPDTRDEPITDHGQAYFPAVPANFHGQAVFAWVESETYEAVNPGAKRRLDAGVLDLKIRKKQNHYKIAGTISDSAGNPISDVRVALPEYHAEDKTHRDGRFELEVISAGQGKVDLIAQKRDFLTAYISPTMGDSGVNFVLQRNK